MTAMTTRAVPARAMFAPPTFTERMLLAGARAMEAFAHRRMSRRQQLAERIAAGRNPYAERPMPEVDSYRMSTFR
ncbi:hypothetical protein PU630_07130 [Microbacterium horticulturae]|uniref:Uncharacterized protein n=1 Tax=Microbacterium horticulturae TaxID=3028316 RepID=A0ABY8C1I5_9MICO|nr:hypothetical protein [Microbacterium sp. KACC 23027]WEG10314.1 hypothetical protein PU630_07130 [Microbacterium sp. KACC 23027]